MRVKVERRFHLALPLSSYSLQPASDLDEGLVAVQQIADTLGINDYAFVGHREKHYWAIRRGKRFREMIVLNARRCSVFSRTVGRDTSPTEWSAGLSQWIKALPKPCGIFAANDSVASHIRDITHRLRIRIPEELALVSVDNDVALCEQLKPGISSIPIDFEDAGHTAARLLAARLHPPHMPAVIRTFGTLPVVRRESTRRPLSGGDFVPRALALIKDRACSGLRAKEVIALFDGSRRAAEMRFREATGSSVLEAIQAERMRTARILLSNPQRQVKAIANFCGYRSENAFRRIFTATYGHPPRG